jgi:flagellar biosynthesis protein FliR
MDISLSLQWIMSVMLFSIRIFPVFILTPLLSVSGVPTKVLILWVLGLSVVMVSGLTAPLVEIEPSFFNLIGLAINELMIGIAFAFGLFTMFGAFHFGGRIIDVQMGFGVATVIDPATKNQAPLMGTFLNMLAVIVFISAGGLNLLIEGIAFSMTQMPIGSSIWKLDMSAIVAQFGAMFIFSVMIVAPTMIAILLLDVGIGVMARTMPQVNVFIISLPVKIFLGLFMLASSIKYLMPLLRNFFHSTFSYMEAVVSG